MVKKNLIKIVIDSGTMITFSSTCLMNVFKAFVRHNNLELIVSSEVSAESVWTPITNKRFALNAARIKHLFNNSVLTIISPTKQIRDLEANILNLANNVFSTSRGPLKILQRGEAEALALANLNGAKAMFVDERTTRSLIESPFRLKQVLEKRQNQKITMNKKNIEQFQALFKNLKMFRSVDIIALAYEQKLFEHELDQGKIELEAALFATKFAGCAVSEKEIIQYLKLSNK